MRVICPECKKETYFAPHEFRCDCGSAWEPVPLSDFNPADIQLGGNSVWRYAAMFDDDYDQSVSLGAGWTPLIRTGWDGKAALFKLEYISPTGSFKDRGTEVEMAYLKAKGVKNVIEDSSGNAGAAMAAYAGKAGLTATIFAPDSASPAKLAQIEIYGAELRKISGLRIEATNAVMKAIENGAVYASHAYNPVYLLGQQTIAWEIWEQTSGVLPDAVVIPVGQCGLLMGAWLGFRRLQQAGVIDKMPKLYAAQPEILAPIHHAMVNNLDDIQEAEPTGRSIADGLAIIKPVRSKRILQALRESGGGAVVVSEEAIKTAYFNLAKHGMFAEPSSAVAAAAISNIRNELGNNMVVLAALTGSGLKTPLLVK